MICRFQHISKCGDFSFCFFSFGGSKRKRKSYQAICNIKKVILLPFLLDEKSFKDQGKI